MKPTKPTWIEMEAFLAWVAGVNGSCLAANNLSEVQYENIPATIWNEHYPRSLRQP